MLLPRKCSTISSIFAPPNVSLEFGIKWPPNHAHFCAPHLRPRSPAQRGGSPESRVPYLSRAAAQNRGCLAQGPWGPSDLRVHICRARSAVPAVCCDPSESRAHIFGAGPLGSIRFASSISVARALWCPAFVATPQICEFVMFHADPPASSRKTGGFY